MIKFERKLDPKKIEICIRLLRNSPALIESLENNNLKEFYDILNEIHGNNSIFTYHISMLTQFLIESGIDIFEYLDTIPTYCFYNAPIITFEVPSNVKHIMPKAFQKAELHKIIFPENCVLYNIGKEAFKGCELDGENIELPDSVSYVEASAFDYDIGCLILPKDCALSNYNEAKYPYRWKK